MTESDVRYQCKTCGETFDDRGDAERHVRHHRSKPYQKVPDGTLVGAQNERIRVVETSVESGIETTLRDWGGEQA